MIAPKPVPKASNISALLASHSNIAPPPQPTGKQDFLAVILQALTAQAAPADNPSTPPQPAKESPPSTTAPAPDTNAASMLLALMVPPLPAPPPLPKTAAHKPLLRSAPAGPIGHVATVGLPLPSPESNGDEKTKEVKPPPRNTTPTLAMPESKAPPTSGTPVANTSPGMNLKPQRTEIAGKTEQKLPLMAVSAISSADTGGTSPDSGSQTPLPFSWHEAPSEQLAIIDLSSKAGGPAVAVASSVAEAPVRVSSPVPMERLEQMISREAMTIRQTGAQTLGVALNLDSNTQLYLQLTTNNGLVQASVRCDRGQFAPEDAQWAQLQQSLARQNVELLPMTASSNNMNFQQPSGQHPRQPSTREDWPAADSAVQPAQQRKQKEQNRSRKNWESWA